MVRNSVFFLVRMPLPASTTVVLVTAAMQDTKAAVKGKEAATVKVKQRRMKTVLVRGNRKCASRATVFERASDVRSECFGNRPRWPDARRLGHASTTRAPSAATSPHPPTRPTSPAVKWRNDKQS